MKLQAIYNNGKIELPENLSFAHKRFKVQLEVPDEEVVSDFENDKDVSSDGESQEGIGGRINEIVGKYRFSEPNKKISSEECKNSWHEHLEDKHLENR